MVEFITAAFSPVNVVFTMLLLLTGLYWITVILGVLDVSLFDVDLPHSGPELDMDVDADVHVDAHADVGGVEAGWGRALLHFFYIGEVPTMILVSIVVLSLWTFSMLGNYYLNPGGSFLIATPIFIGNLGISIFVMKLFALPLRRFYKMLNKDYNAPADVMGRICRVITTQVTDKKMGQGEVATKGAPIVLNVLSRDEHVFHKGDEAVVIQKDDERGIFLIAPVDLEK